MTTLTVQVAAGSEDGYLGEGDDWGMGGTDHLEFSNGSKVTIGRDESNLMTDYWGWIHLRDLTIPQGATIDSATLHLYYHSSTGFDQLMDPGEGMTVKAEDTDDASVPTNYSTVDGWTLTSASATVSSFIDADEDTGGEMGGGEALEEFANQWYPTHADSTAGLEIKTIIQELVDRSGWASGNHINLKLTPAAHNGSEDWSIEWKDYDTSASLAPKVVINYTAAAGGGATTSPAFLLFSGM